MDQTPISNDEFNIALPDEQEKSIDSKKAIFSKIYTATSFGTSGKIIEVESSITRGLPAFLITGLANSSIQESKQRVQSALQNNNITLPPYKINVNLSPSDLPKNGSHFDLPIALVVALQVENFVDYAKLSWFAFGELGLDGEIKYTQSIYPLLLDVSLASPNANVILPKSAMELLGVIPNLKMHFCQNIQEAVECIKEPSSYVYIPDESAQDNFKHFIIDKEKYFYDDSFELDFEDVLGQTRAKRVALISAAGFHNLILEGSPGCGKSMIAKRMRYILPPSTLKEMIQSVKLQALNKVDASYSPLRSFRSPHQSSSKSSILGSATQYEPKPGEIALAHNGILFFDELPHFSKDILESLREPLENNKLVISRVISKLEYDTSFLFIAAQNPCPCGNLLSTSKECRCSDKDIKSYKNRLSEPFLDRIDMFVQMDEIDINKEYQKDSIYTSKAMQEAVFKAFRAQIKRGQTALNGKLSEKDIIRFCPLDTEGQNLLNLATNRFGLSLRAVNKVLKVSRTIADLQDSPNILKSHITEALSYRKI